MSDFKVIKLCICILWQFFLQVCKKKKRKKKLRSLWRFIRISGAPSAICFRTSILYVLSQYAGTCTTNLVVFGQDTMELQTCEKSYFVIRVNILTLCTHVPFSWVTRHTTACLDGIINMYSSVTTFNNIVFSSDAQFMMFWSS